MAKTHIAELSRQCKVLLLGIFNVFKRYFIS